MAYDGVTNNRVYSVTTGVYSITTGVRTGVVRQTSQ
jgi:hypothetical protein